MWGGVVDLLDQTIDMQAWQGLHTLKIQLYETNNYNPADPKYFFIDNIRLVNGIVQSSETRLVDFFQRASMAK